MAWLLLLTIDFFVFVYFAVVLVAFLAEMKLAGVTCKVRHMAIATQLNVNAAVAVDVDVDVAGGAYLGSGFR